MKKIAVTGGIGSGKSTICKYLEQLNYNIFYSDNVANELIKTNIDLRNEIIKQFSENTFTNGEYNRKVISEIVFNDVEKLNVLNSIFKKYIKFEYDKFLIQNENQYLLFYESALIFEHKMESEFDFIICAYADEQSIINRLKERNKFTLEEIKIRLNSQLDPKIKNQKSNFVINTENSNLETEVNYVLGLILNGFEKDEKSVGKNF
jgi:dephospho-CoA kinase